MRDVKEMHWFLWEAIVMQARDMHDKGLLTSALMCDINFVSTTVRRTGVFGVGMKNLACQIEAEMDKKESEWRATLEEYSQEGA